MNKYEKAVQALEPLERSLNKALDELKHARKHNRGQGVTEARAKAEGAEEALTAAFQKVFEAWKTLPNGHPGRNYPPTCEALLRAEQVI